LGSRAVAAALALALPAAAVAHVIPAPPFASAGEPTLVVFDVVNERDRRATVALELEPLPGFELVPQAPPPGWSASRRDGGVVWTGGRIEGVDSLGFPAEVTATVRAGAYAFRAVQLYDDGEEVEWDAAFTVLPATGDAAPAQHAGRALVAGAVGLVVVLGSLVALHLVRRRRAQRSIER
jgi:hypothetical protein